MPEREMDLIKPMSAKHIIIGEKYFDILSEALMQANLHPIPMQENPFVDRRLASHVDLSVFSAGGKVFMASYLHKSKIADFVRKNSLNCEYSELNQTNKYPHDAQFNICSVGNYFIYNPDTAAPVIIGFLKQQGREGIAVRQGYANCSVCVVDDNSIITADHGISVACRKKGLDVLEISPGHIDLDGFEYGFIGGAAIKLGRSTLAFTGLMDAHPDKDSIFSFIYEHGCEIIFLTGNPAFDVGSAIII